MTSPPDAKIRATDQEGREVGFGGIARRIERYYRRYRQQGEANSRMEAWLDKVMVEHTCPDCKGARVRATRLLFTIAGRTIHDVGQLNLDELQTFLGTVKPAGRGADAGRQVLSRDPRAPEAAAGHRPRLPEFQPSIGHALRRRIAADPAVDADRLGADGHALRPGRTEHRPAPEGQREDDRDARTASRHRQHRDRRRTRRGHDSRRRPRRGDGSGAGRARRPRRGSGHARRCHRLQGVAHRSVLLGTAIDRRRRRGGATETASRSSCAGRARTT